MNSSYWLERALINLSADHDVRVRLDPLLIQPKSSGSARMLKMLVYGQPLDWDRIDSLRKEEHMKWTPDPRKQLDVQFTDLIWRPTDMETDFICEEVPNPADVDHRGARYMHSIYVPNKKLFEHADGAIRFYSADELRARQHQHV